MGRTKSDDGDSTRSTSTIAESFKAIRLIASGEEGNEPSGSDGGDEQVEDWSEVGEQEERADKHDCQEESVGVEDRQVGRFAVGDLVLADKSTVLSVLDSQLLIVSESLIDLTLDGWSTLHHDSEIKN
ncbi:hypothetical protein GCK72_016080 [Caenorhabditis remanei]|uniref:Uncharacterized protein n=1 Tax=Caenorhabditis remanei TaxID=31234 RepID=A0A6A5GYY2_CAERE|nr:hypothetical protein GCK72_016080 [Caenorhabditis remanei]KAF1759613.1 hypothetical protein GCK72_016080 [Caenorhabditis remanei]